MRLFTMVGVLAVCVGGRLEAQTDHRPWDPATARWTAAGPNMESSLVMGDPAKSGSFTLAFKLKPGAWIPPHSHPRPKQVTVLLGVLRMGMGTTLDSAATQMVRAGQLFVVPAETAHFEGASVETVVLFSGDGPLVTNWIKAPARP